MVDRSWLTTRGLRALPLHEAWIDDPGPLFRTLREAGSARGFLISTPIKGHGQPKIPNPELRECVLDEATAELIQRRGLFKFDRMFVDEKQQCVLLCWYTDFTLLCMPPALFERWIALDHPGFFADDEMRVTDFEDALAWAFQRFEGMPSLQFGMGPIFDNLAWQFIRPPARAGA